MTDLADQDVSEEQSLTEGQGCEADSLAKKESFSELMEAIRNGSEDAAWRIAELYTPHLLRAVRARLPAAIRPKVDSIDLVNTLWASLLIKKTRLEGIHEPAQLVALLTKAARNRVVDEHRKYTNCEARDIHREAGTYEEGTGRNPSDHRADLAEQPRRRDTTPSEIAVTREKWQHFTATLTPRDRQVVAFRISGKSYDQIAESINGMSARTARRIMVSVVKQLSQ